MHRIIASLLFNSLTVAFSTLATAEVPQQVRASIDRITGGKGSYVASEGVYKVIFPREEATIATEDHALSPNLSLNSWVALTSAIHHEAILTGQFLLFDDEANAVLSVVL